MDDTLIDVEAVPGGCGSIGPFGAAEYCQPHCYARDITSGAGNCVCGGAPGDQLHTEIAPGVPVPESFRPALPPPVAKSATEQRFLLGIAYQAGPQPCIVKGQDGGRDYFDADDLELAAHAYLAKGPRVGLFHMDGTETTGGGEATATVVESYIYRNDQPWDLGDGLVVRKGDWVVGAILSPEAWSLYKSGKISGWSPQGRAMRHPPGR